MEIKVAGEDGEPRPDTKSEPAPLPSEDSRLAPINGKLDAIMAALGIAYGGEENDGS